jgi:adenosine deaminase/aminodeoxyfutalosine deaminase
MNTGTLGGVAQISRAWLRRLPKAELHLHLEGTVSPETLVELSRRSAARDTPVLTLPEAEILYQYTDFTGFMLAFKAVTARLRTPEDYELITYRMMAQLAAQGVVHAEVYVSVGVVDYWRKAEFGSDPRGFDRVWDRIFRGMEAGRLRGQRDFGVSLYWIFDAVRHFGPEEAARVFRKAAELRLEFPSVVGIGIGGDERRAGAEPFRDLYMEARDAGLRLTAHAGETVGPESIWAALNIGAERIGHGLTAIEDPDLMEVLAERQIPVEICVSSNLRTGCCVPLSLHPVRSYFDAGLMITLNSDDPAMFESDLESEYLLAQREFGFTAEHLRELAGNSFEASFLPPEEKVKYLHRIDALP